MYINLTRNKVYMTVHKYWLNSYSLSRIGNYLNFFLYYIQNSKERGQYKIWQNIGTPSQTFSCLFVKI